MTPIRVTLDGRPGAVVDWERDGRDTFALVDLDDGKRTFCRWPSVRIEAEPTNEEV